MVCKDFVFHLYLLTHCLHTDGASTGPVVKEWFVYPGNSLKHPDLVRPLQMTVQGM
jgi:hypothetical protein